MQHLPAVRNRRSDRPWLKDRSPESANGGQGGEVRGPQAPPSSSPHWLSAAKSQRPGEPNGLFKVGFPGTEQEEVRAVPGEAKEETPNTMALLL